MTGRQAGGPETYDTRLAHALAAEDRSHIYTIYGVTAEAARCFDGLAASASFRLLRPTNRVISFGVSLPLELWRRPVDVLHATYVAPPWMPGRLVLTVHDLSPFSHPHFYPVAIRLRLQMLLRQGLGRADVILASSMFTRDCIVERFPWADERTLVVPLGVDDRFTVLPDRARLRARLTSLGIDTPYVLYVGKLQARKNIRRLVSAFAEVIRGSALPHTLVLAGRKIWQTADIFEHIAALGIVSRLRWIDHVSDDDLPVLYNGADVVLYPSLFEGFGLPVLESMACGTPVVTSTTSALPEVAGDAALLVDPDRVSDIAKGLHAVLSDRTLADRLRSSGLQRAARFRWSQTARCTLAAYRRAVEPASPRAATAPAGGGQ